MKHKLVYALVVVLDFLFQFVPEKWFGAPVDPIKEAYESTDWHKYTTL